MTTGGENLNETCDLHMTYLNVRQDLGFSAKPKRIEPQKSTKRPDIAGQVIFYEIQVNSSPGTPMWQQQ